MTTKIGRPPFTDKAYEKTIFFRLSTDLYEKLKKDSKKKKIPMLHFIRIILEGLYSESEEI